MIFPALVYKTPGPHTRPGGTYDHKLVNNAEEYATALLTGVWFTTLPEAIAGVAEPTVDEIAAEETRPVTREELEAKAKELGIKFTKKTADVELNGAIEKALGFDSNPEDLI